MTDDEVKDGKHTANTANFWNDVAQKLEAIKEEAERVVVFSQYEKDKINLIKQLPKNQRKKAQKQFLESGELSFIFIEDLSKDNKMFLVMAACVLGLPIPDEYINNFDYGLEKGTSKPIRTVEDAISNKSISYDFINAWAEINDAYGYISALTGGNNLSHFNLNQRYLNGTAGNIIEQHIYAYWMHKRWDSKSKIKNHRQDLHEELAEQILQYILKNPKSKYKNNLENMINRAQEPAELKGRIVNMKAKRILQLVQNGLIDPQKLPNLNHST